MPAYKTDFIAAGVFDMIRSRGGELTPWLAKSLPVNDETFQNLLVAERPKLQLVRRVQVARTAEEAARLFAALPGPTSTTVLLSDDPQVVAPLEPVGREPAGTVEVETFSANRLRIRVAVEGKDPAWLVYADAWHPGWRATVDGRTVPILRANLGFKAILVGCGIHDVRMRFDPRPRTWVAWCFALIETVFGMALCGGLVAAAIGEFR